MYARTPSRERKNGQMSRTWRCMRVVFIRATPLGIDGAKTTMHYGATIIQTLRNVNFLLTATVYLEMHYHGDCTTTTWICFWPQPQLLNYASGLRQVTCKALCWLGIYQMEFSERSRQSGVHPRNAKVKIDIYHMPKTLVTCSSIPIEMYTIWSTFNYSDIFPCIMEAIQIKGTDR